MLIIINKSNQGLENKSQCYLTRIGIFSVTAGFQVDTSSFSRYTKKGLTSATLNTVTSSKIACVRSCLRANGCMGVSVTMADDVMFCNLATQFNVEIDVVDDVSSDIFVLGEFSKGRGTDHHFKPINEFTEFTEFLLDTCRTITTMQI